MREIQVGDLVQAYGHAGRWEVTKIERNLASLKLIAKNKDGFWFELVHDMHEVPITTLVPNETED